MSLAELDGGLFARKGEAAPAPLAGRDESARAFGARHRLILVPLTARDGASPAERGASRRRAVGSAPRRRFTFRLGPDLHARLAAAAAECGLSRQRYLEQALLARLDAGERP